jgi:hypothetical protein
VLFKPYSVSDVNKLQFNPSIKIMDLIFVTSLCFSDFGKENEHRLSWEEKRYLYCSTVNFTAKEIYYLSVPTNAHTYIKILNCITNAPACFGASAQFLWCYNFSKRNIKTP